MCASQLCWNVSAGDCGLSCRFDRSLLCDGGDKHATSGLRVTNALNSSPMLRISRCLCLTNPFAMSPVDALGSRRQVCHGGSVRAACCHGNVIRPATPRGWQRPRRQPRYRDAASLSFFSGTQPHFFPACVFLTDPPLRFRAVSPTLL